MLGGVSHSLQRRQCVQGQVTSCLTARRNFIVPMDLEFFMPPEKIPQALKALDVDGDGKISLADMRDAVIQVRIEKNRKKRKDYTFRL